MDVENSGKGVLTMPRPRTKRTPKPLKDALAVVERLKQIRIRRGLSQAELGDRVGLSQRSISSYECGFCRVPTTILLKIAEALKVSLKAFSPNGKPETPIKEPPLRRRIVRRLKLIEALPRRDQQVVLRLIDNTITATNGQRVAA